MSKIVMVARQAHPDVHVLAELRKLTGLPLNEIRSAMMTGTPLIERKLFGNQHDDDARTLLGVGKCLVGGGVAVEVFELEPDEVFETAPLDECRIDLSIMERILNGFSSS